MPVTDPAAVQPEASTGQFFSLTPERVLDAVEQSGHRTSGLCYQLGSLENRVFEVELEDGLRLVSKFYRPGRWSKETILDEHHLLSALVEQEIPVCAPTPFPDGGTLHETTDGIMFALFPRCGGRSPEELSVDDYRPIGRLIARIHNVSASLDLRHRPELTPQTYGRMCLATITKKAQMNEALRQRYADAVERLVEVGERRFSGVESFVVHADCHRGNLLFRPPAGWYFLDFDDMASGPAVQDLWLLLPARPEDCPLELEAMLEGYEQFRAIDYSSVRLVEVLRGLRYVRYAAWIASRWDDPSFRRAFPHWGTDTYWQDQLVDVHQQLSVLEAQDAPAW